MTHAFIKSGTQSLKYETIIDHFGDSILPYLKVNLQHPKNFDHPKLPILLKNRIRYTQIRPMIHRKCSNKQEVFFVSNLRGPRQEMR